MRRGSAEAVVSSSTGVDDKAGRHCLRRVVAASASCLERVFLDKELRAGWSSGRPQGSMVHVEELGMGTLLLTETIASRTLVAHIAIVELRPGRTEVRVVLSSGPALDLSALYSMGVDDLWEERLNAITDLLMMGVRVGAERGARP